MRRSENRRTSSRDDYPNKSDFWSEDKHGEKAYGKDHSDFKNLRKNIGNDGVDYAIAITIKQ